jgi:uncharacterized protein
VIQLPRPGDRDFIVDKADLITPEHEQQIKQICDKLLTDTASPIIVVTIESMQTYLKSGRELPWETFARVLFDEWGIGQLTQGNPPNSGILLLVSRDDRKARIELGVGWNVDRDGEVQGIMQKEIVPRFKQGKFSDGILAGVQALDRMARSPRGSAAASANRSSASPSSSQSPAPSYSYSNRSSSSGFGSLLGCGGIGLIIAVVVIFIIARGMGGGLGGMGYRRSRGWYGGFYPGMGYGPGGWGWGGGGLGGGGHSGGGFSSGGGGFSGGGGGGFSGGSFGGGFSGGHGASGSW